MQNKKIIYVIYPESFKAVVMNDLAMCELILNEFASSQTKKIKFNVNNSMKLIECNDSSIKKTLDLLLKAGKLSDVKMQLLELMHKDNCVGSILGKLKFLVDDKQINLIVKEIKPGDDFAWEIAASF